jgi:hypothetical protein
LWPASRRRSTWRPTSSRKTRTQEREKEPLAGLSVWGSRVGGRWQCQVQMYNQQQSFAWYMGFPLAGPVVGRCDPWNVLVNSGNGASPGTRAEPACPQPRFNPANQTICVYRDFYCPTVSVVVHPAEPGGRPAWSAAALMSPTIEDGWNASRTPERSRFPIERRYQAGWNASGTPQPRQSPSVSLLDATTTR